MNTGIKQNSGTIAILGLLPIFYFYALLAMILLGLPVFYLFYYFKVVSWWTSILVGLLIGTIVAVVLRIPGTVQTNDLLTIAPIGAVAAFSFWFIWKQGKFS